MKKLISTIDNISIFRNEHIVVWFNRISLFVVFFWFGFLKIVGLSPAKDIVTHLHHETISSFVSASTFIPVLGVIECLIGVLWLIPKFTRVAFFLFIFQMITTFLPLFLLPSETWQTGLALTLAGQYIIKNVVLIASALTIYRYQN